MNILILGSGGREHAIADKISQSPLCSELYSAPGNGGTGLCGINLNVDPDDFPAVRKVVLEKNIGLVVVGPEAPLVAGVVDLFAKDEELKHIPIIGPKQKGAMLEGSKAYAKEFMLRHKIPTATYRSFQSNELTEALDYLQQHPLPVVLKADGLAAGKGVVICNTTAEALAEMKEMLFGKFGNASMTVVVEQFLSGIEFSVFVLTDGKDYVLLPEAKDYKRIGEGDTGLNTGGMGAISPVPFVDEELWQKVRTQIIEPTLEGLQKENIEYTGFIFFGLINVKGDPYVIEYNCRLGDPETEAILPRIESDFVQLLLSAWNKELSRAEIKIDARSAATIMLVSGGYPGSYEKNKMITGLDDVSGSKIYHAGTQSSDGNFTTSGGRVIAVTSLADDLRQAVDTSLANAELIRYEGKYYRKDIGFEFHL